MTVTSELCTSPLLDAARAVEKKEISPLELTRSMLERIESVDRNLNSYLTVASEFALQQAAAAEREILDGMYRGPLHGIPLAVKDLIFTQDVRTTCASKILADWVPDYNATVIEKLYRAGAVLLGKLTLTEFAGIGYHPTVKPALNPWDTNRWTGSSSSGSGVATAASLCFGSLGTDTGGSIRFPAAACGVVGLKPTYGRVSRYGVFPLAESLDHVGPLTRRVADTAAILQTIAGFDENDATTRREPVPTLLANIRKGIKGVRFGVDWSYATSGIDPQISEAISAATRVFSDLGSVLQEVKFSSSEDAVNAWGVIFTAECGAAHEATYPALADHLSVPFRTFLQESEKIRGSDYAKAHVMRQRVAREIDNIFQSVDLFVCPTMGMEPMKLDGAAVEDLITPQIGHDLLKFTSPFSLSGNPALSIPCGESKDGLPFSLTLVARHGDEPLLLQAGHAYEQATSWHKRRPPVPGKSSFEED